MQIGIIGLGRMGANIARRLLRHGHECVVFNRTPGKIQQLAEEGASPAYTLDDFISKLVSPRVVWLMLPAGEPTEQMICDLAKQLSSGDMIIDGGNSYYVDDIRRSSELTTQGIHYIDVGTSGGVWGLERGYCLMIGGATESVQHLDPIFQTLAPGTGEIPRTPGREQHGGTAEQGYLHCGASGAGHFVKMVHNGIEYGLMAAYAEGLNILHHANIGKQPRDTNAETAPLRHPEHYEYEFNLADIAEVWRRGSVVASWLLDLSAISLLDQPDLSIYGGRVSDSGEGRWTVIAAIDEGIPAPVLSAALYQRFSSRGGNEFADKLLSAMRYQFGGHHEQGGTH